MVHAKMPFGKHIGERISGLPLNYLRWLTTIDLKPWLCSAVEAELSRRGNRRRPGADDDQDVHSLPTNLPAVLAQWHREMSLRFHPDRGGSVEAMAAINHGLDRLQKLLMEAVA